MDNVIVRTANKGDAEALADLLRQVGHVHAVGRPDIYHAGLTKYDEASAAALIEASAGGVIVAIADGRVVGEMILRVMTREDDGFWKKRRWLYIDDLCVDAAWRGMGVAEKLDAFAEEIARSEDCVSIELNCWAFNERAAAFYKRMGYRPQKTEYEKILNDGKNDQ